MESDRNWLRDRVSAHLLASAELKRQLSTTSMSAILTAADLIAESMRAGGKLLLCGNGGSAADCQHMAAEFVNRLTKDLERPGLPAIALTTDTSFLTAHTNDYAFESVFVRQLEALGKPGDTLIGISTSGNSANVTRAMEAGKAAEMHTIALTGRGGALAGIADVVIAVPSHSTHFIQEAHLTIEHILCDLVECHLYGKEAKSVDRDS